ncbi:RCK C-terminal domain-containing protein [Alicyclobacillus pomorum]
MDNTEFSLVSLLIVTALGLLVPLIVTRIRAVRIPIVVGEIIAGVVVGKSGFNIIQNSEWLQFLQFFGLAFLMFVSGLEIDFATLKPTKVGKGNRYARFLTMPPVFATFATGLTFVLSYSLSQVLFNLHFIKSPLLFSLILTTTSLTVVVPVLKEYGVLNTEFGQLVMATAVMADFVTMILISVATSLYQGGLSPKVLLFLVLITVLVVLYVLLRRIRHRKIARRLQHGTAQVGVRAAFAIMLVFLVLSQYLGVQVILGTFLAGILVGLLSDRERTDIYHKLDAIGFGFLIPIFFIMIGVSFDIKVLFQDPKALLLFPILLLAVYIFKALPGLLLRFKFPWRKTTAGAVLLTTQMSVTVAAAEVALKIGAISPGVNTAIILVAMLTSIISPVLFGKILPNEGDKLQERVGILGQSPGASLLVNELEQRHTGVIWERNTSPEVVASFFDTYAPSSFKALVVYSENDEENIQIARNAVNHGIRRVIASVQDIQFFQKHYGKHSFTVVNPQLAGVALMEQLVETPVSSQLLSASSDFQIHEVVLRNRVWSGRRIRDITLPESILILSIVRDGVQLVAHGDTVMKRGDTLVVVGPPKDILEFHDQASSNSL